MNEKEKAFDEKVKRFDKWLGGMIKMIEVFLTIVVVVVVPVALIGYVIVKLLERIDKGN